LFALSPPPSAQLFVAAGLSAAPLLPPSVAFFAGRLVSYPIYASAASEAWHSLDSILETSFRSPIGIAALPLVMLAGLVLLVRSTGRTSSPEGSRSGEDATTNRRDSKA
jgi:hypothetical protein